MTAPQIIPATKANLEELGEHPSGAGRAYAAVLDGRTLGVCGYYQDRTRLVIYSKVTPELRRWKKVIVRGARMAMAAASRVDAPIAAVAEPGIPGSARMLMALGFEQVNGDLYWRATWRRPH